MEVYMDQEKLNRINELARLSKQRPLTEEEKEEQAKLRKEYVALVHNNLRGQLQRNEPCFNKIGSPTAGKNCQKFSFGPGSICPQQMYI